MELDKALAQLSDLHSHLARTEFYRDFRALPAALSGVLAMAAAAAQPALIGHAPSAPRYVGYWAGVAVAGAAVAGGGILANYLRETSAARRHRTRVVVGQLLPCLTAGIIAAYVVCAHYPSALPLLPAMWAMFFGLGVFAARPYLPRAMGYIGLYYLFAGGMLLALAPGGTSLSPWGIGLTFGIGQMLSAIVLYWNLERGHETT